MIRLHSLQRPPDSSGHDKSGSLPRLTKYPLRVKGSLRYGEGLDRMEGLARPVTWTQHYHKHGLMSRLKYDWLASIIRLLSEMMHSGKAG